CGMAQLIRCLFFIEPIWLFRLFIEFVDHLSAPQIGPLTPLDEKYNMEVKRFRHKFNADSQGLISLLASQYLYPVSREISRAASKFYLDGLILFFLDEFLQELDGLLGSVARHKYVFHPQFQESLAVLFRNDAAAEKHYIAGSPLGKELEDPWKN